jgi:hypothetical protein
MIRQDIKLKDTRPGTTLPERQDGMSNLSHRTIDMCELWGREGMTLLKLSYMNQYGV